MLCATHEQLDDALFGQSIGRTGNERTHHFLELAQSRDPGRSGSSSTAQAAALMGDMCAADEAMNTAAPPGAISGAKARSINAEPTRLTFMMRRPSAIVGDNPAVCTNAWTWPAAAALRQRAHGIGAADVAQHRRHLVSRFAQLGRGGLKLALFEVRDYHRALPGQQPGAGDIPIPPLPPVTTLTCPACVPCAIVISLGRPTLQNVPPPGQSRCWSPRPVGRASLSASEVVQFRGDGG